MTRLLMTIQVVFFFTFTPVSVVIWELRAEEQRMVGEMIGFVKYTTIDELTQIEVRI